VIVKKLILSTALILSATTVLAMSPEYEISKYPAWVKDGCLELTKTKTKVQ